MVVVFLLLCSCSCWIRLYSNTRSLERFGLFQNHQQILEKLSLSGGSIFSALSGPKVFCFRADFLLYKFTFLFSWNNMFVRQKSVFKCLGKWYKGVFAALVLGYKSILYLVNHNFLNTFPVLWKRMRIGKNNLASWIWIRSYNSVITDPEPDLDIDPSYLSNILRY